VSCQKQREKGLRSFSALHEVHCAMWQALLEGGPLYSVGILSGSEGSLPLTLTSAAPAVSAHEKLRGVEEQDREMLLSVPRLDRREYVMPTPS
jgi:hypothetical protein